MIILFRLLIAATLTLIAIGLMLPFNQPYKETIQLDSPIPPAMLGSLAVVVAILMCITSSYGLFRFRPWSVKLAGVAALFLAGGIAGLSLDSAMRFAMNGLSLILLALAVITWVVALALTRSRALQQRFRIAL